MACLDHVILNAKIPQKKVHGINAVCVDTSHFRSGKEYEIRAFQGKKRPHSGPILEIEVGMGPEEQVRVALCLQATDKS
jgi:hypothetical protein